MNPTAVGADDAPDASLLGKASLLVYLLLLAMLLLALIIHVWPAPPAQPLSAGALTNMAPDAVAVGRVVLPPPAAAGDPGPMCCPHLSGEQRLLLLVVLCGALGAIVHAIRSVSWYLGHGNLKQRWMPMYFMLPINGAALALGFYLILRGGLTTVAISTPDLTGYGFAALSVLVGMFTNQAILKLKEVADHVFTKPPPGANT